MQMLSQQMGSLLRNAVDVETVNGEKAFFDQVGSRLLPSCARRVMRILRLSTRRTRAGWSRMSDYEYADLIDDQDKVRMLDRSDLDLCPCGCRCYGPGDGRCNHLGGSWHLGQDRQGWLDHDPVRDRHQPDRSLALLV
jgi:hypothetical protein